MSGVPLLADRGGPSPEPPADRRPVLLFLEPSASSHLVGRTDVAPLGRAGPAPAAPASGGLADRREASAAVLAEPAWLAISASVGPMVVPGGSSPPPPAPSTRAAPAATPGPTVATRPIGVGPSEAPRRVFARGPAQGPQPRAIPEDGGAPILTGVPSLDADQATGRDVATEAAPLPPGADLITDLLPFDGEAIQRALARLRDRFRNSLGPPEPGDDHPYLFPAVAAVLAYEGARRWRRRRQARRDAWRAASPVMRGLF